jgi:DNA-binding GntR family transcriptional regulator
MAVLAMGAISRSSLRDQVYAVLMQRLVSGDLMPGEIYSAQALAIELGVSGSPVREAMLTLVNQGFMEPVRNRGFMVVSFGEGDRAEIAQLRTWLEVPAMAELARRSAVVKPAEPRFRDLIQHIIDAAEAHDLTTFLDADREFHIWLTELVGNRRLTTQIGELRSQTRLYGLGELQNSTIVESAREHAGLLDAVLAGDSVLAADRMAAHLERVLREWVL